MAFEATGTKQFQVTLAAVIPQAAGAEPEAKTLLVQQHPLEAVRDVFRVRIEHEVIVLREALPGQFDLRPVHSAVTQPASAASVSR